MASTALRFGDRQTATESYRQALVVAASIKHRYEQGRAHDGIATCTVSDDPEGARAHWQAALAIFERMGVPERHGVAARLATL
jgi:hypothetical protein